MATCEKKRSRVFLFRGSGRGKRRKQKEAIPTLLPRAISLSFLSPSAFAHLFVGVKCVDDQGQQLVDLRVCEERGVGD